MRIQMLGLNYMPEPVGIATYTSGLARELTAYGHDVRIVSGKPYYPQWQIYEEYRRFSWSSRRESGVEVTRVPLYVPAQPTGAKRIAHHLSFAGSALVPMLSAAVRFRPDLVFTVAPSLIAAPVARLTAGLCGARSWLHIQDFEIEAAFATGLIGSKGTAARAALAFQKRVIRSFDVVSAISQQMCAKVESLGVPSRRIVEFRNWAELGHVHMLDRPSVFRAEWGVTAPYVALYSGNIGNKQGISIIVEAARRLARRPDILFVVCGSGPQRDQLVASARGLTNIRFEALQPMERLGELMNLATVHLLPQLAGAADLLLPSKLTNMLASGRPVIALADQGTSLAAEVAGCGMITPPGQAGAFADAIVTLVDDEPSRTRLGTAGRRRAEERWARDAIINRLHGQFVTLMMTGALPEREVAADTS